MDALKLLLANFFAKFKTKNPIVYLWIVAIVAGVYGFLSSSAFSELTGSPQWLTEALKWIAIIIGLLSGTDTTAITQKKNF